MREPYAYNGHWIVCEGEEKDEDDPIISQIFGNKLKDDPNIRLFVDVFFGKNKPTWKYLIDGTAYHIRASTPTEEAYLVKDLLDAKDRREAQDRLDAKNQPTEGFEQQEHLISARTVPKRSDGSPLFMCDECGYTGGLVAEDTSWKTLRCPKCGWTLELTW